MDWHKIIIVFLISLSLTGCKEERKVNPDRTIDRVGILHNDSCLTPSTFVVKIIYPDSIFLMRSRDFTSSFDDEYYINIKLSKEVKRLFSSKAKYHLLLDDTLFFEIENIKIKTDSFGVQGRHVFCRVDSFTVNGTRVKSRYSNAVYPPMSLGIVLRE